MKRLCRQIGTKYPPLILLHVILYLFIFQLCYLNVAFAKVIIFDEVTGIDRPVGLKAFTGGKFFPEGGRLVKFYVNNKHIGTTLSGGDGYAFLKYTPSSSGVSSLKAEAGSDTDRGLLLVAKNNDRVLLIEIENTLIENMFLLKPQKGSYNALKDLSKKFKIVYLTSLFGLYQSRKWIKDNDFPRSSILTWKGAETISEIREKGINPYAIVASPEILAEALDIKKRFSFKETEDGMILKDWDDMLKQLE
jgi:hypothetical protein